MPRRTPQSGERGAALAIALLALVVVGALAAGAFFAAIQDQRLAENTRRVAQAQGAAEVAADDLVTYWDPAAYDTLPVYPEGRWVIADAQASFATPGQSGQFYGAIYRLNHDLFLIDVTGRNGGAGARQRVGLLARLLPFDLPVAAALISGGSVTLSNGASVSAGGPPATGWGRCLHADSTPGVPGIRAARAPDVSGGTVVGNPSVTVDSTIGPGTFGDLGAVSYAAMSALAGVQLPPGTYQPGPAYLAAGACNRGDPQNWGGGAFGTPCADYLPVIHIAGNAILGGIGGQGVLLVDGDLDLEGPWDFAGVVVVRGSLRVVGGIGREVHIYGTVMTQSGTVMVGQTLISYSKCFIGSALSGISLAAAVRSRGLVELY